MIENIHLLDQNCFKNPHENFNCHVLSPIYRLSVVVAELTI